jgi:6-phosphogluconolactonase/glucosamine-6-phosphate isomerase/deaminase
VLEERHRLVAVTGTYQGERRMTLTYEALAHADRLLWLVTGADKRSALSALLSGDTTIPAGGVSAPESLVMADRAATAT